jgi:hypothetical protein
MTTTQAIDFVKKRFPEARLERFGPRLRGRYTIVNVEGAAIDCRGKLSAYVRPERAWKKIALRIKRRKK